MKSGKSSIQKFFQNEPVAYEGLIYDLSRLIEEGRRAAVRSVNTVLTATYWLMGKRIVSYEQKGRFRAEYGEKLLVKIAAKLVPIFGRGFNKRNLDYMRQFYLAYPEIVNTACSQSQQDGNPLPLVELLSEQLTLSWSHYRSLMRVKDGRQRNFYESECRRGNWSVRQLDRQIQSLLYQRIGLSKHRQAVLEKAQDSKIISRPEDEIKDPYVLEFLGLKDEYSESELEDALIAHLENFLLELGRGFTFISRQKRFDIAGNHYRIDLLLYNRLFRALTLIDLKIGDFNHSDVGQMNFYLNWAKTMEKLPGENDPVGVILCSGKDKTYVQYALGGLNNKIFVSNYKLKLPKTEEFKRELQRGRRLFLERRNQEK